MKCNNILEAMCNTPLIRLNRIGKDSAAEIYVKADYMNPGGSVKDRIGLSMIDEAERTGKLKPGGTIIEGTSGNTGMGLALVACVRGYKVVFTINDKQSREKIDLLKAFGAEVIVCPTAVEPEDPRSYYSVAQKLAREIPNSYYPNQYENPMNPEAHYKDDRAGNLERYRRQNHAFRVRHGHRRHDQRGGQISEREKSERQDHRRRSDRVALLRICEDGQCRQSEDLRGGRNRRRFFPGTMNLKILDDVLQVNDEECFVWARRLAKQEGIFTGGSGGGCIAGALACGQRFEERRSARRVLARLRFALSEQGLQRWLDARTRLRRGGSHADRRRCDSRSSARTAKRAT